MFFSLKISCLSTRSVIFPLFILLYIHLFIVCLFSDPKAFQFSRCACKLPQTRLWVTLTEIVYDQFQGPHWSFFNKALPRFYSKVCHCDFTKYLLWNREPPPLPFFPTWNDCASFGECLLVASNPQCGSCNIKNSVSLGSLLKVCRECCFSRCGPQTTRIRISGGGAQESAFISTSALGDFDVCWNIDLLLPFEGKEALKGRKIVIKVLYACTS